MPFNLHVRKLRHLNAQTRAVSSVERHHAAGGQKTRNNRKATGPEAPRGTETYIGSEVVLEVTSTNQTHFIDVIDIDIDTLLLILLI